MQQASEQQDRAERRRQIAQLIKRVDSSPDGHEFIRWLFRRCNLGNTPWNPDERTHAFLSGRHSVASEVCHLLHEGEEQ